MLPTPPSPPGCAPRTPSSPYSHPQDGEVRFCWERYPAAGPQDFHDFTALLREAGFDLPAELRVMVRSGARLEASLRLIARWDVGLFYRHLQSGTDPAHLAAGLCLLSVALPFSGLLPYLAERTQQPDFQLAEIAHCFNTLAAHRIHLEQTDSLGRTALHLAAELNQPDIVLALIQTGAKLDATDTLGRTPLHLAIAAGAGQAADALLAWIPALNVQDHRGATPLHLAAQNDDCTLTQKLIDIGARADLPDHADRTPDQLARDPECRQLITRARAGTGLLRAPGQSGDVDWSAVRMRSALRLDRLADPAPIIGAQSGGRIDVLLTDTAPVGPGWQGWKEVTGTLRECGIAIAPDRRVLVQTDSTAEQDVARGLYATREARSRGGDPGQVFIDGNDRTAAVAVTSLLRLGLCLPQHPHYLLHEMARRADEPATPSRRSISLDERLSLLCAVFEKPHPIGWPSQPIFSTPDFPPGHYLWKKDADGFNALAIAIGEGNQPMIDAINRTLAPPDEREVERINELNAGLPWPDHAPKTTGAALSYALPLPTSAQPSTTTLQLGHD